jgi:hypothetical protein
VGSDGHATAARLVAILIPARTIGMGYYLKLHTETAARFRGARDCFGRRDASIWCGSTLDLGELKDREKVKHRNNTVATALRADLDGCDRPKPTEPGIENR